MIIAELNPQGSLFGRKKSQCDLLKKIFQEATGMQ